MVYALKDKKYFQFRCVSKTKEEFEEKVEVSYWNWRGCRSRSDPDSSKTKEVFLEEFFKVSIEIKKI